MPDILKFSIYCVDNTVNDKKYVGCTTKPLADRFRVHILHGLNRNNKKTGNYGLLQEAIYILGQDKFSIRLLETGEGTKLIMMSRESHWIRTVGSMSPHGYNKISRMLSDEQVAIIRFGNTGISNLDFSRMFGASDQTILIAKNGSKRQRFNYSHPRNSSFNNPIVRNDPYPYITPAHLPADIEGYLRSVVGTSSKVVKWD